ncbi:condensin complex subunit 3 [Fistulifera solaris]|uniref:Condensin complex subunit 3 n=1 Tax=Fistulifera solaris TaxID=1519565 RepID=A0A1Z5K139_FISSO|nr:condensin complex subunit 3 [Fistulifera solaris]|eukprot:GAX20005.1 condensin complex subunit 3 [Fistulifera solaris]
MSSVFEIIRSHCEDHQESRGDDRSLSVERRAAKIVEEIEEYGLATQMQRVALDTSEGNCTFEYEIADQLIHFLECSLYSLVKTDSESKEAVKTVLELLAIVSSCDSIICKHVVERVVHLSEAKLDSVRATVCQFMGWVVGKIMSQSSKKIDEFNDVLDSASQMLLPRMTDKSQSVRLSAIKASAHFFTRDATDPDILQALLWCMQHDTSVANRIAATDCVPINLETIDYVIQRIRDIKSKVRVAALQSIRIKCNDLSLLDPTQCASLLQAGYTERCQETKAETEKVVCLSWMKLVKYDCLQLFKHLSVIDHDKECKTVASILFNACKSDDALASLSDAEAREFRDGVKNSVVSLVDVTNGESLSAETLFMSVSACRFASSPKEKEATLEKILPEISILCQTLEQLAGDLINAIEADNIESQDLLVFMCEQLMKLAVLSDLEEGSRRIFVSALNRLLSSLLTPDDLITEAVETLHTVSLNDSEFLDHTMTVIHQLDMLSQDQEDIEVSYKLRTMAILCAFFETVHPSSSLDASLKEISEYILPEISQPNRLLREAAINCLGRFGLFASKDQVEGNYLSLLTGVCRDVEEVEEIRAQALLSIADWSFVYGLCNDTALVITDFLERPEHPKSLSYIAAEIATKLLLSGKADSAAWLGILLSTFFDPQTEKDFHEFDDVTQVGNPIRVHQILTIFFPAYACIHLNKDETLFEGVGLALQRVQDLRDQRKKASKRGTSRKISAGTFPYTKLLDYVVITMEDAWSHANSSKQEDSNKEGSLQRDSVLRAAVEVAFYLEKNLCDLGVTIIRTLCKWLSVQEIDVLSCASKSLSKLKTCVDGIEMALSDATAEKYLAPLVTRLSQVPAEDNSQSETGEDSEDDQESEELANSFYNLQVSSESPPPKENLPADLSSLSSKRSSGEFLPTPSRQSRFAERHLNVE